MAETKVELAWLGELRFEGGEPGRPTLRIDSNGREAPGPMHTLLLAAAACSGSDVVEILAKMRVPLAEFRVEASGVRRDEVPRRFLSIHFVFHLRGEGLDETKARRAIDLSLSKYCSVVHSLAPDIIVSYDLRLA
ncbi:MAG TPA: OsmC family protein [Gemmatimonadales bacterium]|nr:OsmC family protein [Gemmatimonadales bacterium]